MSYRNLLVVWLTVLLAGCSATPVPEALSRAEVPATFDNGTKEGDAWPEPKWWQRFNSEELDGLISEARERNLDLGAAAARVLQADANARIAGSRLLPTVSLAGGAQSVGATDRGGTTSASAYGVNAVASYEVDFWGLARSNLRAAQAQLRASDYARETVALTVTADVGTTYLKVLGTRERLAVARRNLDTAKRLLSAIERMVAAGVSPQLDLAQQQALVASQEAEIPALEQEERETRIALALVLGRASEGFTVRARDLNAIAIPPVTAGLPSELLRRRPDIAQAEASLAAAHANVDAARAAFLPAIVLTASGGISSGAASAVSTGTAVGEMVVEGGPAGLIYGVGMTVLQTVFDAGRREAQRDLSWAQEQELVANYRAAVFSAFGDVETALSRTTSLKEQERLKTEQVQKETRAYQLLDRQYRQGLAGLLALLQAQQNLFAAQEQLVQVRLARIQAVVALYKALGGGWVANGKDAPPEDIQAQSRQSAERPAFPNTGR